MEPSSWKPLFLGRFRNKCAIDLPCFAVSFIVSQTNAMKSTLRILHLFRCDAFKGQESSSSSSVHYSWFVQTVASLRFGLFHQDYTNQWKGTMCTLWNIPSPNTSHRPRWRDTHQRCRTLWDKYYWTLSKCKVLRSSRSVVLSLFSLVLKTLLPSGTLTFIGFGHSANFLLNHSWLHEVLALRTWKLV